MRNVSRFWLLLLVMVTLALFGCSKQETIPEPTPTPYPTPTPPPKVTGNKHCASGGGGNSCDLTSDQVYDEDHGPDKSLHTCAPWDDDAAIHITMGTTGPGKFKKIHVTAGSGHAKFDISVQACPGSTANPFPSAKNMNHDDWDSGDLGASIAAGSHYRLLMTETGPKGKKMTSDPHIVITP